jgi:DNA-directed RNA polymerase subunit RPC12/RpoP
VDKSYIKSIVQRILDKSFTSSSKRKIVDYEDRLNLACPYCGDSNNEYKKRGNLYFNKLFYICFNCDKKTSFDKLSKDFNEILDPSKKMEIINHLNSVIEYKDFDLSLSEIGLEKLISLKDLESLFNGPNNITPIFDFKPISKGSGIHKYLIGRGIPDNLHTNIYQAKFSKGDDGNFEHIIVLLNRRGDRVLGLQVRNLKGGKKRFFLIYNWESLYRWVNGDDVDLDMNESIIYNKISYYFNILNVDFSKIITIFEGYLDSLFYPNSIGVVGTNTDLRTIENQNLEIQYFFDNDVAGFKKSEEKIRKGGRIFLWKKLFEDIVKKKKDQDPDKLLYRISKVKDMNKLNEIVPNAYQKLDLPQYFSEDMLDIRWIPKNDKFKKFVKIL